LHLHQVRYSVEFECCRECICFIYRLLFGPLHLCPAYSVVYCIIVDIAFLLMFRVLGGLVTVCPARLLGYSSYVIVAVVGEFRFFMFMQFLMELFIFLFFRFIFWPM